MDEGEDEEESMSLKDVIMTLNDFYSTKLEGLLSLLELSKTYTTPESLGREMEKIEKIVKDNEVRIPYDEDIFIGIDKNYKILKKTLVQVKEKCLQSVQPKEEPQSNGEKEKEHAKILAEKEIEIQRLKVELAQYKAREPFKSRSSEKKDSQGSDKHQEQEKNEAEGEPEEEENDQQEEPEHEGDTEEKV